MSCRFKRLLPPFAFDDVASSSGGESLGAVEEVDDGLPNVSSVVGVYGGDDVTQFVVERESTPPE